MSTYDFCENLTNLSISNDIDECIKDNKDIKFLKNILKKIHILGKQILKIEDFDQDDTCFNEIDINIIWKTLSVDYLQNTKKLQNILETLIRFRNKWIAEDTLRDGFVNAYKFNKSKIEFNYIFVEYANTYVDGNPSEYSDKLFKTVEIIDNMFHNDDFFEHVLNECHKTRFHGKYLNCLHTKLRQGLPEVPRPKSDSFEEIDLSELRLGGTRRKKKKSQSRKKKLFQQGFEPRTFGS